MRSIWNGTLRFGLVTIPVGLAATRSKNDVSFRLLHRPDRLPVKQVRVCPEHGQVDEDELVRGWEVAKGQFVPLEAEELAALQPDEGRGIELVAVVAADAIDELYVERSYWLVPSETPIGRRAYVLFAGALAETDSGALCKIVAWGGEHNCLVKPTATGALLLQTLVYAEDLAAPDELLQVLGEAETLGEETELARQLALKLRIPFTPALLVSAHRARTRALLESKLAGEPIIQAEPKAEQPALVTTDLAAALKKSIRGTRKPKAPARQKTAAR